MNILMLNFIFRTKSVSDACICLNTNFTKVCERLNRLGDTVDNVKIRQKDVKILVDLTTTTFQEKILNISNGIEDSLKQGRCQKVSSRCNIKNVKHAILYFCLIYVFVYLYTH